MKPLLLLLLCCFVLPQDLKPLYEYMNQVQAVCGTDFKQCL